MEQHLLAYLTTKYGVRQLITQWLTSILAAVEHFAPLDAQTALFGKVLRNEVEEEFEEAQLRVITTADSLLHSILQVLKSSSLSSHIAYHDYAPLPPRPSPKTSPRPPLHHNHCRHNSYMSVPAQRFDSCCCSHRPSCMFALSACSSV